MQTSERPMADDTHRCRARRRWLRVAGAFATLSVATHTAGQSEASPVEVWIDLSEPVAAGAADAAQAQQRRLRVSAQQDRVAQRLRELGVVELGRIVHARNAILVRIAPEQVASVLAIPGVKRLRPVQTLHPPKTMP
jgi:hypothetical protein